MHTHRRCPRASCHAQPPRTPRVPDVPSVPVVCGRAGRRSPEELAGRHGRGPPGPPRFPPAPPPRGCAIERPRVQLHTPPDRQAVANASPWAGAPTAAPNDGRRPDRARLPGAPRHIDVTDSPLGAHAHGRVHQDTRVAATGEKRPGIRMFKRRRRLWPGRPALPQKSWLAGTAAARQGRRGSRGPHPRQSVQLNARVCNCMHGGICVPGPGVAGARHGRGRWPFGADSRASDESVPAHTRHARERRGRRPHGDGTDGPAETGIRMSFGTTRRPTMGRRARRVVVVANPWSRVCNCTRGRSIAHSARARGRGPGAGSPPVGCRGAVPRPRGRPSAHTGDSTVNHGRELTLLGPAGPRRSQPKQAWPGGGPEGPGHPERT